MFMTEPQPSDGFEWAQAPWGRVLRCRPLLDVADHFFTAAPLVLRQDEREWRQVADLAGVPRDRLRFLHQVHGRTVVTARQEDAAPWRGPEADGVASDDPSVGLVIRVADCVPLLLADRRTAVVAAVHAGWRSTMQRIATAAIETMTKEFGVNPSEVVAAIGPSLGRCCGEMGEEVVEAFRAAGHGEEEVARWFSRAPGARPHFDLWAANADQLQAAGVAPASIHVSQLCTRTHSSVFHSYRAAGKDAGRMAGVIRARSRSRS